jgi:hypothetical protein
MSETIIGPKRSSGHVNSAPADRLAARSDGIVPVQRLRVRGTWRVVDREWAYVSLQVRTPAGFWLNLTNEDHPPLVARRFSGKEGEREAPELTVVAMLRRYLSGHGAHVFGLDGSEARVGDGVTEWRYWASVGARLTVGIQTQADGTATVIGL